jgi:hypothetical protein
MSPQIINSTSAFNNCLRIESNLLTKKSTFADGALYIAIMQILLKCKYIFTAQTSRSLSLQNFVRSILADFSFSCTKIQTPPFAVAVH